VAGSINAYTAQVDRVLGAGQGLFAAAAGVEIGGAVTSAPDSPGLTGDVNEAAERYRRGSAGLSQLDADTTAAAHEGRDEAQRGHAAATAAMETAHAQAAAITGTSGSPAGVRLLVSRMDERLAAIQNQIADTQATNRVLALRLRQVAAQYRQTGAEDRKVHGG